MNKSNVKEAIKIIKESIKEEKGYVLFSGGKTIIEGDKTHCICSIAWGLSELMNQEPSIYSEIMKKFDEIKKWRNKNENN